MALAACRIMLNPSLLKTPCRYARRALLDIPAVWMRRGLTPGRGPCVLLRVQRPGPRALDEEKKRAEQLGQVGAAFVQDGPEAGLGRDRGQGQGGRAQEQGDFGGENGHEHLANEKQGEGAGPDAQDEAEAAHDFEDGDGRSQDLGQGHAELGEAAHTLVDEDELDHALPEKDPARHQADPEGRLGRPGARVHEPYHDSFHVGLLTKAPLTARPGIAGPVSSTGPA